MELVLVELLSLILTKHLDVAITVVTFCTVAKTSVNHISTVPPLNVFFSRTLCKL